MSKVLMCPRGHRWESNEQGPWSCPECGIQVVATEHHTPQASESATLAKEPPDPSTAEDRTVVREGDARVAPPTDLHIRGYEILGELGRGGMGVVYQARDVELNRIVALKMVLAGEYSSAEELRRFQAEAEAEARMKHRHIVQIYDIGEHEGHPFVVLEFIEGGSLSQRLSGGPLPAREAAQLLQTVCEAVEHAHSHQVIHRDLKPANILLTAEGQPKVADFGLAKRLDEEFGQTQSGAILGTPSYMAPEQASGHKGEISPATDVYALGTILYECLTGKPPFQADTSLDTIMQVIADEPVPPRRLHRKVPRDLETIVLKCLHKAPQQRYATARELGDDLGRFLAGEPISARRPSTAERMLRWLRRHPVSGALMLLVLVAVGLAGWWWGPTGYRWATNQGMLRVVPAEETEVDPETEVALLQQGEEVARLHWEERHSVWLPAGKYRVELAGGGLGLEPESNQVEVEQGRQVVLRLRPEKVGELKRFKGLNSPIRDLAVSPDGSFLLTCSGFPKLKGSLRWWDLRTGKDEILLKRGCRTVAIAANGQRALVIQVNNKVSLWDLGKREKLSEWSTSKENIPWSVAISADGQLGLTGEQAGMVRLWDLTTGKQVGRYHEHGRIVRGLAISPDGRWVLSGGDEKSVVLWDLQEGKRVHRLKGHRRAAWAVCFHPDGTRFFSGGGDGVVCMWDRRTGQLLRRYVGHSGAVRKLACSTDGQRLVSASLARVVRVWDVDSGKEVYSYHKHTDGTTSVAFVPSSPRASGRLLVSAGGLNLSVQGKQGVVAGQDFAIHLWKIPHDAQPVGRGCVRAREVLRFEKGPEELRSLAVSRDGRWAVSTGEKTIRLWEVATGRERARFMGHGEPTQSATFSSDGQRILSTGNDGRVLLWDVRTGKVRFRHNAHFVPGSGNQMLDGALSADGRLALTSGEHKDLRLWDLEKQEERWVQENNQQAWCVAMSSKQAWGLSGGPEGLKWWDLKTGKLLHLFKDHQGGVRDVLFVPGKQQAVSCANRSIRLWNLETRLEILRLEGHLDVISHLAISSDGKRLYSADRFGLVLGWDLETGQQVVWCKVDHAIRGLEVLPDGRFLTADQQGQITLWNPEGEQNPSPQPTQPPTTPSPHLVHRLRGHHNGVAAVIFSPDGKYLLSAGGRSHLDGNRRGGREHTIALWEVQTGKKIRTFEGHAGPILGLDFTPDGQRFASVGVDRIIRLWEVATGKQVERLTGHTDEVRSLAFSSVGKQLVSAGYDSIVRVWDVAKKTHHPIHLPEGQKIWRLAFSSDDKKILCGGNGGQVYLLDVEKGQLVQQFQAHPSNKQARCVAFLPGGNRMLTAGNPGGHVRQWTLKTEALATSAAQQVPGKVFHHPGGILQLALSRGFPRTDPRSQWIVTGGKDGTVRVGS